MDNSEAVDAFFEAYGQAIARSDVDFLASAYADSFMFAGPDGAQAVKLEDFLKVIPRRQDFFGSIGLMHTTLRSVETTPLDEHYVSAKVGWTMTFRDPAGTHIVDENAATYILRREADSFRIVLQIDHQDLAQRARELGLLPSA
jgi:ketosteroid isomerase-like protein